MTDASAIHDAYRCYVGFCDSHGLRSVSWILESPFRQQGELRMKKMDEAIGMTIEVPEGTAQGRFPYYGFWSNYSNQIAKEISRTVSASQGDITAALNQIIELVNGPYRVLLADKIWRIGETLDLNPMIAVTGRHGGGIRQVPVSPDGGRLAFAAHTFEKPVKIVLETARQLSNTSASLVNLDKIVRDATGDVNRLNIEILALQGKLPTNNQITQLESSIKGYRIHVHQAKVECDNATASYESLSQGMNDYARLKNEMHQMVREKETIGRDIQNKIRRSKSLRTKSYGSITTNEGLMALRNQTQALANRNMQLHQRISNLGLHLEKLHSEGDQKRLLSTLKTTKRMCEQRLRTLSHQLGQLEHELGRVMDEKAMIEAAIVDAEEMLRIKSLDADAASRKLNNARSVASNTMTFNAEDVVKVFADHLTSVQMDVERYLFENLRAAQSAISSSPTAMEAAYVVSPEVVRDYEAFLSALDMIGDAIDNDEYDLLQKIAKFGASQSYVPGSARVMALIDMNRSDRLVAYRNMIEEILANGTTAMPREEPGLSANFSVGNFSLKFDFSRPLDELETLVNHLANSGLEFQYQGGE